ncbi:ABC transporter substrate-binding protein [Maribacter sp. 2-571]|uniref:ABC transporter substrate-binding protein n=1 Tax=Maribacter sp. 2-571 TaxID=3417569 RepID=UPI003D32D114
MLKVCSFLPAVTQMIYDMGLQEHLYGVTFECPQVALLEKNVVVRCVLEGGAYSSREIDRLFSESKRTGKSLYYVEEQLMEELAPDLIFTQDVCDVCQIDTAATSAAIAHLKKRPLLISITPNTLEDVFDNALTIATAIGKKAIGMAYVERLKQRMSVVTTRLKKYKVKTKRISLLEWIDPLFNCGHWIPDQIAAAGGVDLLSNPSGNSTVLQWEDLTAYDPEIIGVAPCGFTVERTLKEIRLLTDRTGWVTLSAVRSNAVYSIDFDLFTQSSASTLVDGIELLAALFHPEAIPFPKRLVHKIKRLSGVALLE